MNKQETSPRAAGGQADELSVAEANLGTVLVLIQRVLPRLDEADRADDVQAAFRKAASCLEVARQAHEKELGRRHLAMGNLAETSVASETLAVIAAAIAAVLDSPYRLVSVQPASPSVPHLNVWALEGRTQIFQSHKIR
jgi:hypothetical protein